MNSQLVTLLLFGIFLLKAQVGIGTKEPKAILDIQSKNSGILIPRLTTAEKEAIEELEEGLLIYNRSEHQFEFFNGSKWKALQAKESSSTHFLEVYISEYSEGTSYNKYIELYNPTNQNIKLEDYALLRGTNGNPLTTYRIDLIGEIDAQSTFVIANSRADQAIVSKAQLLSGAMNFTGDDALGLIYKEVLLDVIGQEGERPVDGWEVNGVLAATKDHTLCRKSVIEKGDADWGKVQNQWQVKEKDDWYSLGFR